MNKARDQEELDRVKQRVLEDATKINQEIANHFATLRSSYKEILTNFENISTLERMFAMSSEDFNSAKNSDQPKSSYSFDKYLLEKGHHFKTACKQLSTLIYVLEQSKRDASEQRSYYYEIRDSILMSIWSQVESKEDLEMMKYFGDICFL